MWGSQDHSVRLPGLLWLSGGLMGQLRAGGWLWAALFTSKRRTPCHFQSKILRLLPITQQTKAKVLSLSPSGLAWPSLFLFT